MNEHIDIILTASKLATRNNPWSHLATHAVSMGYNVSMLWYYNNQQLLAQSQGPGYMHAEQIQAMKQDCRKHKTLLLLESVGVLISAICSLQDCKRY